METAPLYEDIANGPGGGSAVWIHAKDGVRLRVGHWPGGDKGTVLLFPGRTEYIEKYGPVATELRNLGYGTLAIDWRGQGLADRLADDAMLGHVGVFQDYQLDVGAMVKVAENLKCPRPFFLLAHSFGGCVGLRALHNGLAVNAAAFTGPMWGIAMPPLLRKVAKPLSRLLTSVGRGLNYAPTTEGVTYVKLAPFQDNELTTDPDMWAFLVSQAKAHPELTLAGPSVDWLREALHETEALQRLSPPDVPAMTHLGDLERVVAPGPVHEMMEKWKNGRLHVVDHAEHEIMMETPSIRAPFYREVQKFFAANSG